MLEWLLAPIDAGRAHLVDGAVAWHGRFMVTAWGLLLPLGVLVARFFKVLPWQDWPRETDNRLWWQAHLWLQYSGGILMLAGFGTLMAGRGWHGIAHPHALLGYLVLSIGAAQFAAGWLRGSKGGPTAAILRGDHYDMTSRRRIFEYLHKSLGYIALLLACAAILSGLWLANAPRWMWFVILGWWALLGTMFVILQRQGRAIDTYQAIWGPDLDHPGNLAQPIGWSVRRLPLTNPPEKQG